MIDKQRQQLIKKNKGLGSQQGDGKTLEGKVFCAVLSFIGIAFILTLIFWAYNRG